MTTPMVSGAETLALSYSKLITILIKPLPAY